MKKNYVPQPMDTSDIQLSDELNVLVEQMAKNVHEVWAQSRISQGWSYGEERNDALKQHPCLVPYEELPEIEKAYDRDTAQETLKFICKLSMQQRERCENCRKKCLIVPENGCIYEKHPQGISLKKHYGRATQIDA